MKKIFNGLDINNFENIEANLTEGVKPGSGTTHTITLKTKTGFVFNNETNMLISNSFKLPIISAPEVDLSTDAVYTPSLSTFTNDWILNSFSKEWDFITIPGLQVEFRDAATTSNKINLIDQNGNILSTSDKNSLTLKSLMAITSHGPNQLQYLTFGIRFDEDRGYGKNNVDVSENIMIFPNQTAFNEFLSNPLNKGKIFRISNTRADDIMYIGIK